MSSTNDKRLINGVDIFVEASFSESLPQTVGNLRLAHVASRGTKLKGDPLEKNILDVGWLCARYLFDTPAQQASSCDNAICQLIEKISAKHVWSSVVKLYSLDGKALYS